MERSPNRGFWPLRDLPTVIWLLLALVSTFVHRWLPEPRWLMIHLLFLGAITHAILVWSEYFSHALLRSSPTVSDRRRQSWRLALSNGGAVLVIIGVPLAIWPLTIAGATAIIAAVLWHAFSLVQRSRGSLPGKFGRNIRYYVLAALFLPIGAGLGAWLAGGDARDTLVLAHAIINVLGWIGLTVAGTVITLWPTILRTRADEGSASGAIRALPVLAAGVAVAALGAAVELIPVLTLGLIAYAAGLGIIAVSLWREARQKPPHSFAALSVGMGLVWWAGSIAVLVVAAIKAWVTGGGFTAISTVVDQVVPYLAAGFAAQVLLGALSYLVPVVLGGGPRPVRIGTEAFDRGATLRIVLANTALFVTALPVASVTRVIASLIYIVAMGSFLPIMMIGMRTQRRAKSSGQELVTTRNTPADKPSDPRGKPPGAKRAGQAVAGLLVVVLATAIGGAIEPQASGLTSVEAQDEADAPVVTVAVSAADMRFTPNTIDVPAGSYLVIELTNTDATQVHDLVVENGARSGRLSPGETATIDVGVITASLEAWCSIAGHKQMGMTLAINATGEADVAESTTAEGEHEHGASATDSDAASSLPPIDLAADPGPDFAPYDALLPELPAASGPVTHEINLNVTEQVQEVAPGIRQNLWTFGGSAPGPTLHGRVGDTFIVTLVNDGTIGHSIDFHAGALAPDEPMRTIPPGESLTYTFTATRAGIWYYHCATVPMSAHIANGMYGAVIIEPENLPAVDKSYVLVQGEYYLGAQDGELDYDKLAAGEPDLVAFNGYAAQYDHAPLTANVGERIRIWVLNAGIERPSSFHVIGGQFDTTWMEGTYLLNQSADTGSQALGLFPAQGGFVELEFPEAGHYPFVSHLMLDAERGAHGFFEVGPA